MNKLQRYLALGVFCLGVGISSVFGQNFEECDYIRRLNVNRFTQTTENTCDNSKNFPTYDNFKEPFSGEAKNSLEGKVMKIYFQNDNCNLSKNDSIDLRRYVLHVLKPYSGKGGFEKLESLNFRGFADCNGNPKYNHDLSHKRAENTAKYVEELVHNTISPSVKIYISAFGEDKSTETKDSLLWQKDRVVEIIFNENPLKDAMNLCKGKIYLLDQSGSMGPTIDLSTNLVYDWWSHLQDYSFPIGTDVFFYSEFIPPRGIKKEECDPLDYPEMIHTYDIKTEIANGATCYYPAKNKLLSSSIVEKGSEIVTLINGKNDFNKENPYNVIKKAKEKDVQLHMIGIDLSGNYVHDFIDIANETGGKYYFINIFKK